MEMHQLRYFLAVAEEGNFTRAAAKSYVSQPSLSAQIIKLEEELGAKLFSRMSRRVELTDAGVNFEGRARRILMEVENAQREIGESSQPKGVLKVGVTPTVAPYLMPPAIARCRVQYPELEIRLEENLRRPIMDNLLEGHLEVAISSYSGDETRIDAEPILQEGLYLVVPTGHRLEKKSQISIRDFADEPMALLGESLALGNKVLELFERNDYEPRIGALCSQVTTVEALVREGVGLSILPEMARESASAYGLTFKPLVSSRMTRLLFAITHSQRYLSVGARAFLDALRKVVDERD